MAADKNLFFIFLSACICVNQRQKSLPLWPRLVVIAEGVENRRNSGDVQGVGPDTRADESGFLGGQNAGSDTAEYSIAAVIQHICFSL
jgi:hypothetical protein